MGQSGKLRSYAEDRSLPRLTAGASFPVLDDADSSGLESMLTRYFDGGGDATCSAEVEPKTCPL